MKNKREMIEAIRIAIEYEKYVNENNNDKYSIKYRNVSGSPGEWYVAYDVYGEFGTLLEGPLAMVIDEDGEIKSLDEHIMNEMNKKPI